MGKHKVGSVTDCTTLATPSGGSLYLLPDIANNASFELTDGDGSVSPTGQWDNFKNGSNTTPDGGVLDLTRAYIGSQSIKRNLPVTGYAITALTALSPTTVTAVGSNLPNSKQIGIVGTPDSTLNSDFFNANRFSKAVDVDHFQVFSDAGLTLPVGYNGASLGGFSPIVQTAEPGGGVDYWFAGNASYDRLWVRWYFYLDAVVTGPFKFCLMFDQPYNTQFSGIYFLNSCLACSFTPESDGTGSIASGNLKSLSSLVGAWHSVELDYWRNGDPTGFPSAAIWVDNVQMTGFLGGVQPVAPASWINGRLNFGMRSSSAQIGHPHWLGVWNRGNLLGGNVWVDKISISTRGRIGP